MKALLEFLGSNWPDITFYVVILAVLIYSFNWVAKNFLNEYKSLLKETRSTNQSAIDDFKVVLNQYKERNEEITSEIGGLNEKVESLQKKLNKKEKLIDELEDEVKSLRHEIDSYSEQVKSFFSKKLSEEDYSDIKINIRALFSERDKIKEDLDLIWNSLLKFSVVDDKIESDILAEKKKRSF